MSSRRPVAPRLNLPIIVASAAPAIAVALAILLPSLGKAFTIDDVTFLLQAKHVLQDPRHPTAFAMVYDGVRSRLSRALVTGPVMAYLLVPSVLVGGSESLAHALQAALLSVGLIATTAVGLRLTLSRVQAALAAVLIVASPAVLGMAATAMPDVPAMVFAVVGVERALAWRARPRAITGISAAVFLALAALSRPHVLLVLPCVAVLLLSDRPPMSPSDWMRALTGAAVLPIAGAIAIVLLVVYATRDPVSGESIAGATAHRMHLQGVAFNVASFAVEWAVAFPLVILWPFLRGRRFVRPVRTPVAFGTGVVIAGVAGYAPRLPGWSIPVVLLTGLSAAVLADVLGDAWTRGDMTQLALGLWLLLAIPAAAYVQLPAKLLVPSAPAMALLLAREIRPGLQRAAAVLVASTVAIGTVVGGLVIRADAALAEVGRAGGLMVRQQVRKGNTVWMDGAWGYQWYAMEAGAQPLADTPPFPHPGDIVVLGPRARQLRNRYATRTLLYRRVFNDPGGRVVGSDAGFFTNWSGPWPWVWGQGELGRIEVWRIDSAADYSR